MPSLVALRLELQLAIVSFCALHVLALYRQSISQFMFCVMATH